MQFIFLLLIFLIFLIIALLALPYHYALTFSYHQKLDLSFYFSVLFLKISFQKTSTKKLLFLEIFNYQKEFELNKSTEAENSAAEFIQKKSKKFFQNKFENFFDKTKTEAEKDKEIEAKDKKKKSKFKFPFSLIDRENLTHLLKFILNMINKLKPEYLKLDLLFSFSDPYYNGLFLAYYYTLKSLVDYPEIRADINWQEVVFKADGAAGGKFIPLSIIWQFLAFIFSLKSLKIFWQLYKSK